MPEMAEEKLDKVIDTINKLPGYIFELTANLGSERSFSIRGNFPTSVSIGELNTELDKLVRATDRQLSKACIASLEDDLAKTESMLKQMENNVKAVIGKTKGYKELPPGAVAEQENARANVEAMKATIERKKATLIKTREDAK